MSHVCHGCPIINPSVISLRGNAGGGTNMPSKVWMSDFDKGSNDIGTVERTAGARGYLANNDRPTHKIRQERSRWARCNSLSIVLLPTCRRPNAAVLGQRHHKQCLADRDEQAGSVISSLLLSATFLGGTPGSATYVPQSRQNGPPISKMVEYRTTRHDQLHEIMI
jgi:hypothetical protein